VQIVGIDLSGPSNVADTYLVMFRAARDGLRLEAELAGADDTAILQFFGAHAGGAGDTAVGIDAPLSYNPGGGDRPGDMELRKRLIACGMHPGSVMTPTMTRMAYLTLRGIALARALAVIAPALRIVEVHPGATLALRDAPIKHVREMSRSPAARRVLLKWLGKHGLKGLKRGACPSHYVAACAAALATWDWTRVKSRWLKAAEPPLHPFDFAC